MTEHSHAWKVRLCVGLLMLVLGLIGIVVTDLRQDGAWAYWRFVSILYAILGLGLSLYLRKMGWGSTLFTLWHELFHWLGLILAIMLVSHFVQLGTEGRFQAGLQALVLLSLATYLAGLYLESTFFPIGITLGLFAMCIAFFNTYLYSVVIPFTFLGGIGLVWTILHHRKKHF